MGKVKVIAYYLPQFHEIEENNEWWGNGFTEWTNVKKAVPLAEEHYQPRVPLNRNYYSLLDKETVKWQTELADKYGVYGFAYYHYWYNGKLLLEKPAENLLKWKDINQRFFFFWANHTWFKAEKGKKSVLMLQEYGDENDWIRHFEYMLPFFKDDRYIKLGNMPIVGIYMPKDIPELDSMLKIWDECAQKNGFAGIYIIESKNSNKQSKSSIYTKAMVARQPNLAFETINLRPITRIKNKLNKMFKRFLSKPVTKDFKEIIKLESQYQIGNTKEFIGVVTGWDNTSRHGKWGTYLINENVENFRESFENAYNYSLRIGAEFLFINAWNEWAEGMYLEPDENNKFRYLEAISSVAGKDRE